MTQPLFRGAATALVTPLRDGKVDVDALRRLVEQQLEKLAQYCDKLVLMQKGKVVAVDTPEKIFAREDLEEIGMEPPVFVKICKMCGLTNPDGTYPVTLEATVRLFEQQERQMYSGSQSSQY